MHTVMCILLLGLLVKERPDMGAVLPQILVLHSPFPQRSQVSLQTHLDWEVRWLRSCIMLNNKVIFLFYVCNLNTNRD